MTFSVIIPCYNSERTIIGTLDSVVSQSYEDWEIIIVDDCSTDNSARLIRDYIKHEGNEKIKLIVKNKNSGPAESRNIGISHSKGDYLIFLDSDDKYQANALETISECIQNDKADIVCYGYISEIGSKNFINSPETFESKNSYIALRNGSLCTFASSRSLWEGITFPDIKNAEDIAVIPIIFARASKISVLEECLYRYIFRQNSLSSRKSLSIYKSFCQSFEATRKYAEASAFKDEIEFHGIKTILYGAILNAILARETNYKIGLIIDSFETDYPNWKRNKYLPYYSKRKKIFLSLVAGRVYLLLRLYAKVQDWYLNRFSK